jgi:hypothetical protein
MNNIMTTAFYGILVQLNDVWVKKLVVGVPANEIHDGLTRILKVLHRFHEFASCPWTESRAVRINLETEPNLQEWREMVRGRFMVIQLDCLEKAVHVLFGLSG